VRNRVRARRGVSLLPLCFPDRASCPRRRRTRCPRRARTSCCCASALPTTGSSSTASSRGSWSAPPLLRAITLSSKSAPSPPSPSPLSSGPHRFSFSRAPLSDSPNTPTPAPCAPRVYDTSPSRRAGWLGWPVQAQGGDPTGTGRGGQSAWSTPFKDEFHRTVWSGEGRDGVEGEEWWGGGGEG